MKVHVVLYTSNKADIKPRKGFIKGHFFVKLESTVNRRKDRHKCFLIHMSFANPNIEP